MKRVARTMGLTVNRYIDERKDFTKSAFAASECIKLMNKRWYAGRQLSATYWDGATDYTTSLDADDSKVEEAEKKRLENFGDWIEEQELPPE